MPATVLLGTQWGDEGKGKVTDILAEKADAVVRFQGGNNAGHTIVIDGKVFKLHIVPSGVLRDSQTAVIGDGCVVDPWVLKTELDYLHERSISTENVILSDRAHLIMPYHRIMDGIQERNKEDGKKVGTTKRGIGPAYQDKAARIGIRVGDLRYQDLLKEKVQAGLKSANLMISAMGRDDEVMDFNEVYNDILEVRDIILPHVRDVPKLLDDILEDDGNVLLEGAQGVFLDIDKGTYPFVTSSSCTAGYGCAGVGIGPLDIEKVVGIVKAYTTRVGEGPFPTELKNQIGERIQNRGHEVGTTTDRTRRCGWLDLVMVRSAGNWNSITDLVLTKIDVLSGIDPLMVCTEYRIPQEVAEEHGLGTTMRHFPSHLELLAQASPVYKKMEGWPDMDRDDWMNIKESGEIPKRIQDYIDLIEREVLSTVSMLSFGKGREETMDLSGENI